MQRAARRSRQQPRRDLRRLLQRVPHLQRQRPSRQAQPRQWGLVLPRPQFRHVQEVLGAVQHQPQPRQQQQLSPPRRLQFEVAPRPLQLGEVLGWRLPLRLQRQNQVATRLQHPQGAHRCRLRRLARQTTPPLPLGRVPLRPLQPRHARRLRQRTCGRPQFLLWHYPWQALQQPQRPQQRLRQPRDDRLVLGTRLPQLPHLRTRVRRAMPTMNTMRMTESTIREPALTCLLSDCAWAGDVMANWKCEPRNCSEWSRSCAPRYRQSAAAKRHA